MDASLIVLSALHGLASLIGAVSLGIGGFLYLQHRTPVLRRYLVFLATLFLFVLAFAFRLGEKVLAALTADSPQAGWALRVSSVLAFLTIVVEMVASAVHVLILPPLIYSFAGRVPPEAARIVSVLSAVAMGGAGLAVVVSTAVVLPQILLSVLLFGTIAFYLGLILSWLIRSRRAGEGADAVLPPRVRAAAGPIRAFLLVSACFVPLFVLDIVLSMADAFGPVSFLDDSSVPAFFVIVCTGSIAVAYRYLSHPPLMEEQSITLAAKASFGLTDREAELIEYVLEGFTLPDAAGVMGIAPKTAENHLYSAYRKIGVTNRIQLFQFFTDNRRA